MVSRVQNESQTDSLLREAIRSGGPVPFQPQEVGLPENKRQQRLAGGRQRKLKGLLPLLATLFLRQR